MGLSTDYHDLLEVATMPINQTIKSGYMEGTGGLNAVDWQERISMSRMRSYRRSRAAQMLVDSGVDAALLLSAPNIRYVAGVATNSVSAAGGFHYTLLTAEGKVTHWDSPDHAVVQRRNCPWLDDVRYVVPGVGIAPAALGPGDASDVLLAAMADEIAGALRDHGIASGKIAFDTTQNALGQRLEHLGFTVTMDAGALLGRARAIKSHDEVECLRMTAAICDAGFQAMKEMIKPGARDNEIWAEAVRRIISLGGEHGGGKLSSGPDPWPKSQSDLSDRIIRPGDVVYADIYNIAYNGYRSCYYRTFTCGKAKESTKDAYKRAVENLYDVLGQIRPGASTKEIAARFPDPRGEYWDYYDIRAPWQMTTNHWAHGIGLGHYELPFIWRGISLQHPMTIEEGMTMAVETQDRDESQGVRVEEMVVVRSSGVEVLSLWPVGEITEVV